MLVNQGRNRTVLFIKRTSIFIPSPTGIMLTGVKITGIKLNIPYIELDFSNQGLSTLDVDVIVADTDINYGTELTWRVLNLVGNDPITDQVSYDNLVVKGWTIYGNTNFI